MPHSFSFSFPLQNGLHARPASFLEAVAARFSSAIQLVCERTGNKANVHSVLGMIAADIREGDACHLTVDGPDQEVAFETLVHFLNHEFPHCDESPSSGREVISQSSVPNILMALGPMDCLSGVIVCEGLAMAPLVRMDALSLMDDFAWPAARDAGQERLDLMAAIERAEKDLSQEARGTTGAGADILTAQVKMLTDPSLMLAAEEYLSSDGRTAGEAIWTAVSDLSAKLQTGSAYLQERVADLHDVAFRILKVLYGENAISTTPVLTERSIVCASDLTPGQFLALDRRYLAGLALEHGGATSHVAILARAAEIPFIGSLRDCSGLRAGTLTVLDGRLGVLVSDPAPELQRFYQRQMDRLDNIALAASLWRTRAAVSSDGKHLPLLVNVATALDVETAIHRGAEGIGLFRTELLLMNRVAAPDEEEQLAIYQEAIRHAGGRPLVIRTFDIGGDKPIPYLDLPVETNPFLGSRGVRLYSRLTDLIQTQLRALLRASADGPVKIMVPMIACAAEMSYFRSLVEEARSELQGVGHEVGDDVAVGAMLEVPSAIFDLGEISRHADFFSVGTNDLVQYFCAADRDNAATAALGTWKHPSFLRLLQMAVTSAHAHGKTIGLCGEMASRPEALPLLLGLGFDSISLGAGGIARYKQALSGMSFTLAGERLQTALSSEDHMAVEVILSKPVSAAGPQTLLTEELIRRDSSSCSRAEIINELVAMVDAAGRTNNTVQLEEAVWTREMTYATNLGYGFAVPHCKTAHVTSPVIAMAHLARPVKWVGNDEAPVEIAILLAMPVGENRAHLQIFARLSRMIMRQEFRDALKEASGSAGMLAVLKEALEPSLETVA